MAERTLPHNLEAEGATLGAILVSPELWSVVESRLQVEDFYRDAHRRVFSSITRLFQANVTPDLLTLKDDLARTGELDECGGPAYLSSLTDGIPRTTNVEHYADIIVEHANRRRLIADATEIVGRAYDGEEKSSDLAQIHVSKLIDGIGRGSGTRPLPIGAGVEEYMSSLLEEKRHIPTGLVDLDNIVGGIAIGEFFIIAARPSTGKTSLMLQFGVSGARHGHIVLGFSLEMLRRKLAGRILSWESGVEGHRMDRGLCEPDEWARLLEAKPKVEELSLIIDEIPRTVTEIGAWCRRVRQERGGLSMVCIDYLQLLTSGKRHDSRQSEVAEISRGLKMLAQTEKIAVIALSQLSRAPEGRRDKRPHVSDLRESGALEQDADVALLLFRAEMYGEKDNNSGIAECIVAKNRNGPVGMTKLYFNKKLAQFSNLAKEE